MSAPQVEPPESRFVLPYPGGAGPEDVIAVGGDLEPGTILQGYRKGLFPMHLPDGELAWWSPLRRGVLPLDGMRVHRSLRQSVRRYRTTVDVAFGEVIAACADPDRPNGWIDDRIRTAFQRLHDLGWAHSVETWDREGRLVGGLYGVSIGGLFAGESMFHRDRDGSKVALYHLVERLRTRGANLLDVQWATDHLRSLGAVEVDRFDYLAMLDVALATQPDGLWGPRPR